MKMGRSTGRKKRRRGEQRREIRGGIRGGADGENDDDRVTSTLLVCLCFLFVWLFSAAPLQGTFISCTTLRAQTPLVAACLPQRPIDVRGVP